MTRKIAQIGIISMIFMLLLTPIIYAKPVVPGGESIGIKLELNGLLVETIEKDSVADKSGLKKGDFIEGFKNVDEFLAKTKQGDTFKILRNSKEKDIKITPYEDDFGAELKNTISGIGTLTYIDADTNEIYAIGHKVIDIEDNLELPTASGYIYKSKIMNVEREASGSELKGTFSSSSRLLGEIFSNENDGILNHRHIFFGLR